ncbi:LPS export ABC transporter periplasmic protein LptC [Chryseobacterium arthrosphaerae]|uniref:LPS export ABC transporter periplasmic protein LptC n=1 Tax=Chryseobacterium arthrosphaerae TaxID=651561 RepID=A0A1B8ZT16_9FLAO|nr:LPS export ABC transporter periplasmic protein LptC [Chryseobacterium arthrosphaerae]AYZ13134.1 LPS export ABC transporter periplasmic protein LptC [Chryseobacterium arthrosphaerae]MDG4652935.1 LPS export ABC transporter periplasmic protein LptC [Chryseobacterium arthrosphaerae]OCA74699.1 LPS export ABC transporter periplasmic protein LptC [Chryseobacterium arthrosphaerae]QUY53935.1 LPS export ABC transporter periplasmic protein LptC [Chryseobacterium arthrosphaerae]UEQ78409.1 LPS export AB
MNFSKKISYKNIACLFSCAIFFILTSCEEDLTKNKGNQSKNFPSQIINNANIIQRDSGFVILRAKAPIIEKYELIDSPYTVARRGVDIQFYDKKKPKIPGTIKAKYAKFYDYKQFYEAKGNVRITTNEGQKFAMQSIFWDQRKKRIYTKDTVFVTMEDGSTLVGANGMTAKDDFSEYTFYNNSGDFNSKRISENKK